MWHIAMEFCFYYMGPSVEYQWATALCIQYASGQGHISVVWCERSPHHGRAFRLVQRNLQLNDVPAVCPS